jgi:CRISPR system Cascade subunit CasA
MQVGGDFSMKDSTHAAKLIPEKDPAKYNQLFSHSDWDIPVDFAVKDAINMLLVAQTYALGGGISGDPTWFGEKFKRPNFSHATIASGISLYLTGDNLFQSLLLNLAPVPGVSPNDKPCWEWDLDSSYFARTAPEGSMDRFTFLNRMVRLLPERDAKGNIVVRRIYYTQGRVLDKSFLDPMQCYRQSKDAGMRPLLLFKEKAIWRDLTALLQLNNPTNTPAATLSFVGGLVRDSIVDHKHLFQLHITGMASDKAKVMMWRHDQVNLPVAFLEKNELVSSLSNQFRKADEVAESLWQRIRSLCKYFFAPIKDQASPHKDNVSALAKQIDSRRTYWARLEGHLPKLLRLIADGKDTAAIAEWWEEQTNTAATEAMRSAIERLGPSPRAWRAAAAVNPYFGKRKEKENGE